MPPTPASRSACIRTSAPAAVVVPKWRLEGGQDGGQAAGSRALPRPRLRHLPPARLGAPIPLGHCQRCGTVPVPFAELPVRLPEDLQVSGSGNPLEGIEEFVRCKCPTCGGQARRETDTIDCHVDGMWMWMPICVPYEDRPEHMFDHPEYKRWLPAKQIVWGADAGGYMFDQRLIGKVLQDLDTLPPVPGREPFTNALMHQMIRLEGRKMSKHLGNVVDPNELVVEVGADTVRLAVLQAASPGRIFNWNEQPVRYCQTFLTRLFEYAAPRLTAWAAAAGGAEGTASGRQPRIDLADKRRRRLVNWCATALAKVTTDLERLEMQRAAHNAMLLLTRIEDFEQRAREGREEELRAEDSEAIVAALLLLVRMLAPLTPHIAEELWSLAGNGTLLAGMEWPEEVATVAARAEEVLTAQARAEGVGMQ